MEAPSSVLDLRSSILTLLLVATALAAQEAKPKGPALADIQGKTHYPLEVKGAKAAVLFFSSTDCPIANYYTSEINAIIKDHSSAAIRFYVVHVDPDLTPEAAKKHAATYKLSGPILIDAKHELVKATGVTVTPEVALLLPDGSVGYRGRIDDTYIELGKRRVAPNRRELREALAAVLAGQPIKETRTKAIGCLIPELR